MPTSSRRVEVKEEILGANERLASENHARLEDAGVFSFNLMASPGAGKTSLVERTVETLAGQMRVAVVDGDIATSLDADRAAAAGATAIQVNTGGQCHLDALMLRGALDQLDLKATDLLIVENVGNLICPTSFPLGTHTSVLVASVPEGDDKPYKYPGSYRGIEVLVVNKIDLLPYVPFQMDRFTQGVEMLNPGVLTFRLSCRTGEGLGAWLDWVRRAVEAQRQKRGRG
jgi:hydrogenase nickel incorporation protein HypB